MKPSWPDHRYQFTGLCLSVLPTVALALIVKFAPGLVQVVAAVALLSFCAMGPLTYLWLSERRMNACWRDLARDQGETIRLYSSQTETEERA